MKKFLILLCTFVLLSCSPNIKYGRYVLKNSHYLFESWIDINRDGSYVFNAASNVSYRPSGKYRIDGKYLILDVGDNSSYTFIIQDETLVFDSSTTEGSFIKKGAVYQFQRSANE